MRRTAVRTVEKAGRPQRWPPAETRDGLRISLDIEVPERLSSPHGGAIFLAGCCAHDQGRIRSLKLSLGGRAVSATALAMPRRDGPADLYGSAQEAAAGGPERRRAAESSGFWAVVPVPPGEGARRVVLEALAELEGGGTAAAALAEVELAPGRAGDPEPVPATAAGEPLVAICMATLDPSPELFAAQLETIRAQTHSNWVLLISDDGSRPESLEWLRSLAAEDERISLLPGGGGRGAYRGFERALGMVPPEASHIAFADQHGRWAPGKLAALVAELEAGAQLAYADLRIVEPEGAVLPEPAGSDPPADPLTVLLHSPVPGAAAAFRRELLAYALPFPQPLGSGARHDDWIAAVASAMGPLARVRSCLHDHVPSFPGAARGAAPPPPGRDLRRRLSAATSGWRELYFGEFCGTLLRARTLAERSAAAAPRRRLRRLDALAWGGRSRRLALLAPYALGRGGADTKRAARRLLRALAWPAMISNLARRRPAARRYFDASLPPAVRDALDLASKRPAGAAELDRRLAPLALAASPAAPRRVNLLLPAIDPAGLFGGYIGIYNLARRLAESGQRARLVPVGYDHAALPEDWRGRIESHGGLGGLFDQVEVGFARDGEPLEANPADAFLASSWWTAHVAHKAVSELGGGHFVYLIQDYEPSFYPAGSSAALAHESYALPHRALFSTELLREYFRAHRIGVFAAGEEPGNLDSVSFQHAITPVEAGPLDAEAAAGKRLLFYARSEDFAPRNLFDVAVLALADLVAEGVIDSSWTLTGVGTLTGAERIDLGGGVSLQVVSRQSEERYLELLRGHDVGLSLMYSPHPSLVPLEMAAAGQLAVTNSFENKTREAMAAISENLIAAEPTLGGIKAGLREAIGAAGDLDRRRRGAAVAWSRDWDSSLDDTTLAPVLAWLNER